MSHPLSKAPGRHPSRISRTQTISELEDIRHKAKASRFASMGQTALRIVSGGKERSASNSRVQLPPAVSSRDHWYGPTVEITASPRQVEPALPPTCCSSCPYRDHLEPQRRVRHQLSRNRIASMRRARKSPRSLRVRITPPPPTSDLPIPAAASSPVPVPPVIQRFAPPCVAAIEESHRVHRSLPTRLPSAITDRPLPPLPRSTVTRKPVPVSVPVPIPVPVPAPESSTWGVKWPGSMRPSEVEKQLKRDVLLDPSPVKGFEASPTMSSSDDSLSSASTPSPIPSAIKIGNQRLGDYDEGRSLYDELREVISSRGLVLTRADMTWDVSPPSPAVSSATSIPLTPLSEVLDDPPQPEQTPSKEPDNATLRRFSLMALEDQFEEVLLALDPTAIDARLRTMPAPSLTTASDLSPAASEPLLSTLTPRLTRANASQTPRRSSVVHVRSLRAQVGSTAPDEPANRTRDGYVSRWPSPNETRFIPSGRIEPLRRRVPSGPRAPGGMLSDEWLKKRGLKGTLMDVQRSLETPPTSTPVRNLGRILSQEHRVSSTDLSAASKRIMEKARNRQLHTVV
ncbi:hypothetical protein BD324DRAFT_653207 [Kockovaella imperatae]|uniref:Uncharacterized protein n=1 Tax=Kockovaella imperatae TaxID=4999 RepID=A0A1Y1U8R1_9TREE|nr:hypothetical protein BD324DRAFT_653207 [Kockovaella imperatae]ORX34430.1 hypothetical protein BD324DRAFT_653207 [Kockovaella imperatae]